MKHFKEAKKALGNAIIYKLYVTIFILFFTFIALCIVNVISLEVSGYNLYDLITGEGKKRDEYCTKKCGSSDYIINENKCECFDGEIINIK